MPLGWKHETGKFPRSCVNRGRSRRTQAEQRCPPKQSPGLSVREAPTICLYQPVRLLQCDFACENTNYDMCILYTFVDYLLLLALIAKLLHTKIQNFLCEAVEGSEVLVAQSKSNIPILRICSRTVQEDIVVFN